MLKSRVITAVILLLLFLSALFTLPDTGWTILICVIVLQSASEWSRLAQFSAKYANAFWWLTLLIWLGLIWFDDSQAAEQKMFAHIFFYALSAILWLAIVPAWLLAGWQVKRPLLMVLVGWAVLIPTGLAMLDLRLDHPWWLLSIMSLVWVADIAAYFAGRRFGKNKLAPMISPGKTWEGLVGAMLGVSVCIVLVWAFSPYANQYVLLPSLLLAGCCWVGLAVIGDLFESAIKRQAGVKDSGALLPGHGGLLDRIDALTSTLPIAALAMLLQRLP